MSQSNNRDLGKPGIAMSIFQSQSVAPQLPEFGVHVRVRVAPNNFASVGEVDVGKAAGISGTQARAGNTQCALEGLHRTGSWSKRPVLVSKVRSSSRAFKLFRGLGHPAVPLSGSEVCSRGPGGAARDVRVSFVAGPRLQVQFGTVRHTGDEANSETQGLT